jgi:hypothetical protein
MYSRHFLLFLLYYIPSAQYEIWIQRTFVASCNTFRLIKPSSGIWLFYSPLYSSAKIPTLASVYIQEYWFLSSMKYRYVYIKVYSSVRLLIIKMLNHSNKNFTTTTHKTQHFSRMQGTWTRRQCNHTPTSQQNIYNNTSQGRPPKE